MSMRKLMNIMESVSKKPISEMVNFGAMSSQELENWESDLAAQSAKHGGNSALDDAKRLFVPMHERGREWLDTSGPGARIQDDPEYQSLKASYWAAVERAAAEMDMSPQEVDAIVTHQHYRGGSLSEAWRDDDSSDRVFSDDEAAAWHKERRELNAKYHEDFPEELDEDMAQAQSDRDRIAAVNSLEEPDGSDDVMGRFPILMPAHLFDENAPVSAEWYDTRGNRKVTSHPNLAAFKDAFRRGGGQLCRGVKNTMMEKKFKSVKKRI